MAKGGRRYLRVRRNLAQALGDRPVDHFCIAFEGGLHRSFTINPATFLRREYALVASGGDVFVFRLKWPPIFSSRIQGLEEKIDRSTVRWTGKYLLSGGREFSPLPSHEDDAISLAGRNDRED